MTMALSESELSESERSDTERSEAGLLVTGDGSGARADRLFRQTALCAGAMILVVLGLIVIATTRDAWPAFADLGPDYFFGTIWSPADGKYGIVPLVYGTVVVSLIAVAFSVPVSVGIALFITEVATKRVRGVVTMTVDLLAAVPSVVFGLWGFYQLIPLFQGVFNSIADLLAPIPVLRSVFGHGSGSGFMSAGIVLALMITPIISSVAREVFTTVPHNDRLGALALGATRWEMITGVVLPHASGGLTGAILLGLGRAMGETVAVALLIGASPQISANLFGRGEAMPSQIFRSLSEATGSFRAALFGLGVCLFVITVLVNLAARRVVTIADRKLKGS